MMKVGERQDEDGQHDPRALLPSENVFEEQTSQPTRSIIDINAEENFDFNDGGQPNSYEFQSPCIGNKTPPQSSSQVDLPDTTEKITLTPPNYSESSDEDDDFKAESMLAASL